MKSILRPALVLFFVLTIICCVVYPFAMTGIGQLLFPHQVAGSMLPGDKGSELIGQEFSSPKYFWGRVSATSPMPYNATNSSGSNNAPTNPALADEIKGRIAALKAADPTNAAPIPVDLVTSSASGLDPEISLAAAYYQVNRVASERKLNPTVVRQTVDKLSTPQYFGFFGEARVNVLALNVALDQHQ
ncbi:MAG TPA: potassium-transporting ATPase subunit KdpC [Burkholderiaceae bacterium]|jgi:K+-transporting ATPase ATPase C chain|nr:potassium-transporting ATPase subunit KdpC [Burkholderiaceae bacterium]